MPEGRTTPRDSKALWGEIDQQRLLFDISPIAEGFEHASAGCLAARLADVVRLAELDSGCGPSSCGDCLYLTTSEKVFAVPSTTN